MWNLLDSLVFKRILKITLSFSLCRVGARSCCGLNTACILLRLFVLQGFKVRWSGFIASNVTHWAISLALFGDFKGYWLRRKQNLQGEYFLLWCCFLSSSSVADKIYTQKQAFSKRENLNMVTIWITFMNIHKYKCIFCSINFSSVKGIVH